ncbi:hypothetical protein JXB41_01520 [Candidatus Woesearchaeota archaeon]|nr:hypothetical protein [Candidatus Woesearchaeota archaeon]
MNLFKNKKAEGTRLSLWTLIDLFVLLVIVIAFFFEIYTISKNTWFEKRFLAKDIAMMVDTVYASPADVVVVYPQNTLWFSFKFEKNKITVFDRLQEKKVSFSGITQYFTEDNKLEFVYKDLNPIVELNKNGEITIRDEELNKNMFVPMVFKKSENKIEPVIALSIDNLDELR